MRIIALVFTCCGLAAACQPNHVIVYLDDHAGTSAAWLARATAEASQLLSDAGVELVWKYTRPSQHNRCAREIALTIKPDAPSDVAPGVHAVTRLADGSITVYYGRLRPLAWNWPSLVPTLLAQTFAHEIGHSLQRLHRHSDTGILKAHWTIDDFHAMQEKQLRFTPLDAELIRAGAGQHCTTEP